MFKVRECARKGRRLYNVQVPAKANSMILIIESFEGLRKFNEVVCNTPCTCGKVYRAWEEAGCKGKLIDDYGYHYVDCERSKAVHSLENTGY